MRVYSSFLRNEKGNPKLSSVFELRGMLVDEMLSAAKGAMDLSVQDRVDGEDMEASSRPVHS